MNPSGLNVRCSHYDLPSHTAADCSLFFFRDKAKGITHQKCKYMDESHSTELLNYSAMVVVLHSHTAAHTRLGKKCCQTLFFCWIRAELTTANNTPRVIKIFTAA